MRILLGHNSLYYPAHGGGDVSNRLLMEALAARGHAVQVLARDPKDSRDFTLHGVRIATVPLNSPMRPAFSAQVAQFDPDIVITSTDDPALLLFDAARATRRARLVYLVRATIAVPFGPDSSMPSASKSEALRQADGIVGVSEYVADYVRRWGRLEATHAPISLVDTGDWPNLGRFDNPYVLMVNPCAVKGIDIFLALAERMPSVRFAAVPTWGTNPADLAALQRVPNITLLEPVDSIDDLLKLARVVLVPSVWAEARSRIVVEAMLRGVPVMASDAGGIPEAKLGVPYLLPVNLIRKYRPALDENMVPVADVPPQDIGPWQAALHRLTADPTHWRDIAAQSRQAALRYAHNLSVEPFERFLLKLLDQPKKIVVPAGLSEDKRKLLAIRLRRRAAWFPTHIPAGPRLFCFPHAGAGTLSYRGWTLPGIAVAPALLPGRESRASEAAFEDMPSLVEALAEAIRPHLETPYAFFGHSMGAGIAFELARALRRQGAPLPYVLIVSSARAPQLRQGSGPRPDPSDRELLEELSALGTDPGALELALPLLRADTKLYRNYVYAPEPPLNIALRAYGGIADPNVRAQHLESWREQTTASFLRREFPGGHFYLQERLAPVLEALRQDLQPGVTGDS